jgi:DNA-binding transcriptional regulator YiaG
MVTKGRSAKGERHSQTHLSSADIQAIRESNDYQRVIADRYGVSQSAVSYIRNRIHWKHVA